MAPGSYAHELGKRIAIGVMSDGFIHAGNLAYLSLVTLFPFFIVAAAVAALLGQTQQGLHTVDAFLRTVPPNVADVLRPPINDVLHARSGGLLWLGGLVGLWTTTSFVETIRDILRRAYGVRSNRPFWQYRLWSIGLTLVALLLVLIAFSMQVLLTAVRQFVVSVMPMAENAATIIGLSRLVPGIALFVALYFVIFSLTPRRYRAGKYPKWPGVAFITGWWLLVTEALPWVLSSLTNYSLTYGSLAGVMIALIFFFLIGLGLVVGAQINAALAEVDDDALDDAAEED